jgi:hypothetical protein
MMMFYQICYRRAVLSRRGAMVRPEPTTVRGNPAADLLQNAKRVDVDAISDCGSQRSRRPAPALATPREPLTRCDVPRKQRETAKNSERFCSYSATLVGESRGFLRQRPGVSLYFSGNNSENSQSCVARSRM